MDPSTDSNKNMKEEVILTSTLVSNGCVDYQGKIADKSKTGGWKAAPFIIVNEVAERFAFFSIAVNMVVYLVAEMHQPLPEAATTVSNWIGAAYILTLFGAFVADAYLGRFRTIITFSCIYAVGMVLLTLSGSRHTLRPPPHCTKRPCVPPTDAQTAFLYAALALIALGTGGIKPCVSSFGADQFDESDQTEATKKYSFFNWFFFAINMGALFGITLLVYVQVELGWAWGFGIPTGATVISIFILWAGFRKYRYQKPMGSAFTRFTQVVVASVRNHLKGVQVGRESGCGLYEVGSKESDIHGARKLAHTRQYRYLDKAAVITDPEKITRNRWKLCTVTQVEELKSFVRIIPIWASTTALAISLSQVSSFLIAQANTMDRSLGSFTIPSASVPVFSAINALVVVPVYEKLAVPFLRSRTGHPRGITSLQRMGTGLFVSVFAMVAAAVVERNRRSEEMGKSSVFWLFPQCFLIGAAEVFTYVGQLEFFYDEATDGTRSISSAVFLSEIGIGSWLSTAVVKVVERVSGGAEKGWLRDDLNESRLDYFYWILTGINAVNFLVYVWVARRYQGRSTEPAALELSGGEIRAPNGKGGENI